jgi:hypothetical protein
VTIGLGGFSRCASLDEIIFSSDSHWREINGFRECPSLCGIEIPSSVEKIGIDGFFGCTSLNEIVFSWDSHLREINGFSECTSFCRIEIPSSVEKIGNSAIVASGFWGCISLNEIHFSFGSHLREIDGFYGCTSLRVVIIRAGCRVRIDQQLRHRKPFLVYEEDDMKQCRSLIHLGFGRR